MTPLEKERRALGRLLQWADQTSKTVRQNATMMHPDGKEERIVLETTLDTTTQRVNHRVVKDLLAGFLYPADAIIPCKACGAVEGEPCKGKLKPGFVHMGRRLKRLLLTVKARSNSERERFEAEAVKMLRTYLAERRPS